MPNGLETHEWRLAALEREQDAMKGRIDRIERAVLQGTWALVGNLLGIIGVLAMLLYQASK